MRKIVILFTLLIASLVLVACSDNSTSDDDNKVYKLSLNSAYPVGKYDSNPENIATAKYAELVKERTNGKVDITVYNSAQLVPTAQALDALKTRSIDMEYSAAYWGDQLPTLDVQWLPFAFYGADHLNYVMRESEVGEIYEKSLENIGIKPLLYGLGGMSGIMSKEPITSISDFKGKTIRLGSGLWTDWYNSLGAAPVSIAGAEQYEALQRGTIDATVYPLYSLENDSLHEVVKHVTIPALLNPILVSSYINLKAWNEIPKDLQNIMIEVAKELEKEAIEGMKNIEMTQKKIESYGIQVHYLDQSEYDKLYESSQLVWENFAKNNEDTKKMVKILKEVNEQFLKDNPDTLNWQDKFYE